jgi:hypothetical protein
MNKLLNLFLEMLSGASILKKPKIKEEIEMKENFLYPFRKRHTK